VTLRGRAWKFGDNVSTDHIIPGRFYHLRSDLEELTEHLFEDISPGLSARIQKGDIMVGGQNFGLGSSREHAALVIKLAGIEAVVAPSFARIFYRNAINVGLAAIICDVKGIEEGDVLDVSIEEGILRDEARGIERRFEGLPAIMQEILNDGGLVPYIKKRGGFRIDRQA